jgi:hypothetical protein
MMADVKWMIDGDNFSHCSCAYGCPCQFSALPTYGYCRAVVGISIDRGFHGDTVLDGARLAGVFSWPGPIHEGRGEAILAIDDSATDQQREAILRIMSGEDTEPGATIFQVFSTTMDKVNEPIFTKVDFVMNMDRRTARLNVSELIEARGEPIRNPVTGEEQRARIDLPDGFEFHLAEVGRGWAKAMGPMAFELTDSHAHFCRLRMTGSGVIH